MRTSMPRALCSSGLPLRAGHAHHVAERGEDHVRILRHRQPVVDAAHGQHAYRAARAVHQLDVRRQQILQAEAIDGVRVAAAHFHEPVVPVRIGEAADLLGGLRDHAGVAKFIDDISCIVPKVRSRNRLDIGSRP